MNKSIFCVDIGGSKLICGALSPNGEIIESIRFEYPKNYNLETIVEYIKQGHDSLRHYDMAVCGAAIPGLCDNKNGKWLYSPFSGIENIPISDIIHDICGLEVFCDNDVNISALAEKYYGACKNTDDYLWITVSNGIGGGLFLDGKLYRGKHLTAGEIGHVIVEKNSHRKCGCGNFGCLEAMASGASISQIYNEITGKNLSAKDICDIARSGDPVAKKVWHDAGFYIGKASAHAVNLLGFENIILGGGAAEGFSLLEDGLYEGYDKFVFKRANPSKNIFVHSAVGKYAALKGCAALCLYEKGE